MTSNVAAMLSIIIATGFCSPGAAQPAGNDRADLLRVANEVRGAILRQDLDSILAHVSRSNGLGCTDTSYSYTEVRRDLRNTDSHLFLGLFDADRFRAQCQSHYPARYPATSDRGFFERVGQTPIDIEFLADGLATVTYRSNVDSLYPREYTFQKEEGEWKLVYGLIIGSCSCG